MRGKFQGWPPVDWKGTLVQPQIMWMKTVQNDLDSHKLTDWSSQPGSKPTTLEAGGD